MYNVSISKLCRQGLGEVVAVILRERLFARSKSLTPNVVVLVEVGVVVKVDVVMDDGKGGVVVACKDVMACVQLLQTVAVATVPTRQCGWV